jgi:hypothetical protein
MLAKQVQSVSNALNIAFNVSLCQHSLGQEVSILSIPIEATSNNLSNKENLAYYF